MTRPALQITADSLSAALAKMLNGPHSAHRKAKEALERMTAKCPHCGGTGTVWVRVEYMPGDEGPPGQAQQEGCWRCDGTGEIVTDEPDRDLPLEPDSRADDLWFEEDNDRYHADLEAAE